MNNPRDSGLSLAASSRKTQVRFSNDMHRASTPSGSRHRLIVGVDYGTTYSGLSFVTTYKNQSSVEDIQVITSWPSRDTYSLWKVPTRIAYAEENPRRSMRSDLWGCAVKVDMVCCAWTKLLLDSKTERALYDDPDIQHAIDNGILHVPNGAFRKSAQQVCQDFLANLYQHLTKKVEEEMAKEFLEVTPMDCWLTVPATWSDQAKNATKASAKAAGFGSRRQDTINVISEPEAAAIAAFRTTMLSDHPVAPSAGENILVCDCGGGTVDITNYTIVETQPALIFEEICAGNGAKCGSTYLDRNLHQLMVDRFGTAYESLDIRKRGPGSVFMDSWERNKRSYQFDSLGNDDLVELGPLNMVDIPSSARDQYDKDMATVLLTNEDMEAIFEPVMNRILGLIGEQLVSVEARNRHINRLILVGGFADSDYLFHSIEEWCKSRGEIQVLRGKDPQSLVVRGAAIRGLEGTAPRVRRSRKHYGIEMALDFREGKDPESESRINAWDGKKLCKSRLVWLMAKNDKVERNESRSRKYTRVFKKEDSLVEWCNLYSSSADRPPDWTSDREAQKVGTVKIDIPKKKLENMASRRKHHWVGSKEWLVEFDVEINFGAKSGVFEARVLVDGAEAGKAEFAFD